jgi:hypothetical protein
VQLRITPYLTAIQKSADLSQGIVRCVAISATAALSEIVVALSLVPILGTLEMDAGARLAESVGDVPHWAWLGLFVCAAIF